MSGNNSGVEAGLAGPSIYEHFDSKAAILLDAPDTAPQLARLDAHLERLAPKEPPENTYGYWQIVIFIKTCMPLSKSESQCSLRN